MLINNLPLDNICFYVSTIDISDNFRIGNVNDDFMHLFMLFN